MKNIPTIILFATIVGLNAQEVVNSAGGDETTESGSVSYSVGQVFYSSDESSAGLVNEGVQVPYEILVVTSIEGTKGIELQVSAYPNPANDYLMLQVNDYKISGLKYGLYGSDGKLLADQIIQSDNTRIDLDKFTSGAYYLKLTRENTQIKTFKIIINR